MRPSAPPPPADGGPVLALTVGDPSGVGPDLALVAWQLRRARAIPAFALVADPDMIARRAAHLGMRLTVTATSWEKAERVFAHALPVIPLDQALAGVPGAPDPADAPGVIASIEMAVAAVRAGKARAVVTSPIGKKTLYDAGFAYPGLTEFLGALAETFAPGPHVPVMMLAGPELRTVPVTVHIPLSEVPKQLTAERIVTVGRIVARDLASRFGIAAPRLAVAGLNPHAGEGGAMGREDLDILTPAIATLRAEGIDASGPFPADTLFHPARRASYDAVLGMYHDQALIPVKTIAFDETVNVTLGLPFVRTSPDHGTALDIAGTGHARPDSLIAAVMLADRLAPAPVPVPAT